MLDPRRQLPLAEPAAGVVRLTRRARRAFGLALAASLAIAGSAGATETLLGAEEVSRTLAIDSLSVQGDRVAGVIANLSDRTVRDVQLRIVYSWLWADEHRQ